MKIFVSWSGPASRRIAEVLRAWLPKVLQTVQPYVSSKDIDKGARWSADISRELQESDFGIICVTPENLTAPWLSFEAGALSKSVVTSRVSPFLVGLDRVAVTGPLLQFESTVFRREDIYRLVQSINSACPVARPPDQLREVFDVWWPKLETELSGIAATQAAAPGPAGAGPSRTAEDMLAEVLELVRFQQKAIQQQVIQQQAIQERVDQRPERQPQPSRADPDGADSIVVARIRELASRWREVDLFAKKYDEMDAARVQALRRLILRMEPALTALGARVGLPWEGVVGHQPENRDPQ